MHGTLARKNDEKFAKSQIFSISSAHKLFWRFQKCMYGTLARVYDLKRKYFHELCEQHAYSQAEHKFWAPKRSD